MTNSKLSAKRMFILWIVSYLLICVIMKLLTENGLVGTIIASDPPVNLSTLIVALLILLYFLPLMLAVHRRACAEENKNLKTVSIILIVVMILWLIGMLVMLIAALTGLVS